MPEYFPVPRAEVHAGLRAADILLRRAMLEPPYLLPAGSTLATTGDAQHCIYALRSGFMARSRILPDGTEQIMMFRLPGDLVGLRLLVVDRYPDVLRAISPVTLQSLDYRTALALFRSQSDVALRFLWQLAEDERRLHNWIIALGRGSAIQRIATFILDIRGRLSQAGLTREDRFTFPVTQRQIADHLGLTHVHVSRTLRRLRGEKVATVDRGVVEIFDLPALSEYAAPLQDIFERESPAFGGAPLLPPRAVSER
jgi:CRP-like cAMP-binding protein